MIKIHPLTGEITVEYVVGESETRFVLGKNASITVGSGNGIYEDDAYYANDYVIKGTVDGGNGSAQAGIKVKGDSSHILVARTGSLDGYVGASLNSSYETVENHGRIHGDGYGILLNGYNTVENSGVISGDYGIKSDKQSVSITNGAEGLIKGTSVGIAFGETDYENKLNNDGLIKGNIQGISGAEGVETIVNRGTIKGDIALFGGNDVFDNRHGTVDHAIEGGLGNDTLIVDSAKTLLQEVVGQGLDSVRSTVSYKLSANVENLSLLGKSDLDGIGNAEANVMLGTRGINTLVGKSGADTLNGFRGNDVLSGGADGDLFVFAKGTAHDVVTDFKSGEDHIDLSALDSILDFDEMMAHHIKISGDDLVIRDGNNTIRLEHVAKADLDFSDFYY